MKSTKLIYMLQQAHAIEIGAYEAYYGHANASKDPEAKRRIKEIQQDELDHKLNVGFMLHELGGKNNEVMDSLLYFIGRSISLICYIMVKRAANWGAKIMEVMGADEYRKLAFEARAQGYYKMALTLDDMQKAEKDHEEFFKWSLGSEEIV